MEKKTKTTGERLDEMTDMISEVASDFGEKLESGAEETKKIASGVKKWWEKASAEEITTTIAGIVLLLFALWALRAFLWGVILLIAGVLCVSGYFNPFLKELFKKFKTEAPKKSAPKAEKKENEEDEEEKPSKKAPKKA